MPAAFVERIDTTCLALLGDPQVVGYREHTGYAVRADICHILVGLTVNYANQRHMPVVHNDVDGGVGAHRVTIQGAETEYCLIFRSSDLIIHWRKRQHFDIVHDLRDTGNFPDGVLSVRLQHRPGYLPG